MVDSCGTTAPAPTTSKTAWPASWAYSATAANDRAPASAAHAPSSSIANTPWRTPRGLRGSGTTDRASTSDNTIIGSTSAGPTRSGGASR